MDLGSAFSGLMGGGNADPSQLITAVTELVQQHGGVDGLVSKLRDGGLGGAVDSWITTGSNQPVEPQKLGEALGPDSTQQLASKTGLPIDQLLPMLAAILPMIIDHLTPGGQLPPGGGVGSINDIGGLLGGLMGGGGLGGLLGGLGGLGGGGQNETQS